MSKRITFVLMLTLLTLVALPVAAQKVYIDYDEDADFGSYETFAWVPTPEVSLKDSSPLMHSRLKNNIEYQLTTGGMIEDAENPDLYVTYHGESDEKVRVDIDTWGYSYGSAYRRDPYWGGYGGYGAGSSTATVREYEVGTLILDFYDAKEKQLIWRGTATATIPSKPEKQAKLLDKAVKKLAKVWEKKHGSGR